MVLEGANIVSHMGDYPSHAHSEKERKEKAGEIDLSDGVFFRAMEWSMVFEKKPL